MSAVLPRGTSLTDLLGEPVCGMTWGWVGTRGTWDTAEAAASMTAMADHAVTWTALAYAAVQATPFSTDIPFEDEPTVTDDEIVGAIRRAHELGLKVVLKPVVNCGDGTWRAHIGFFDWDVPGEPSWTDWFASYREFILHAARIAEAEGCAMLCIGCEMVRADGQEAHWRRLIDDVRAVYSGLITYNCDKYQEDRVTWWDAVDVISSSGYYPIDSWEEQLDRIERVVEASGKPFFFMEAGCPSRTRLARAAERLGAARNPFGRGAAALLSRHGRRVPRAAVGRGTHAVGLAGKAVCRAGCRGERRLLPLRQARRRVPAASSTPRGARRRRDDRRARHRRRTDRHEGARQRHLAGRTSTSSSPASARTSRCCRSSRRSRCGSPSRPARIRMSSRRASPG